MLAAFKSDNELKLLHRKAFRWHKDLIARLTEVPEYQDLYQKLIDTPAASCVAQDRAVRERLTHKAVAHLSDKDQMDKK